MFRVTVKILSVLLFHILCLVKSGRIKRVIGGKEVACGTQPRVASLRNSSTLQHLCGATLISANFAITASHCLEHPVVEYVVQLNNLCHGETEKAKVLKIVKHEEYNEYSRMHDIALMRVSLTIDDTIWLKSSILPTSSFGLSGECTLYGYGYKERYRKEISGKLLAGQVKIVSLDECLEALGPYVTPEPDGGMLCAIGDGVDACQGDSGGPLICNGVIEAVSSYGMSCGVPGLPGVYTSVGAHLQWIRNVLETL